jgi:hypothetical protein
MLSRVLILITALCLIPVYATTLLNKVSKIAHQSNSLGPSKAAEKFLNSTYSPPGKTRLFGALNVRIKHTDAEGMPTWRYVRVPIDVTAKGTMNYDQASLTKFRVKGLVMSRDAIRQKYGVHTKPKLSWGNKPNPSAYVDVVQGKDRDDAYNKETLDHLIKISSHPVAKRI